jgi:lactose/L-arabinose transport system ATP-binding protein
MTVAENMGFALRIQGMGAAERRRAVEAAARKLHLDHLLDRKPAALSGGQRQRVAIGRAIVRDPKVFLFDEPLSNLDAELRVQMRIEIARLHQALGNTMVYVTHDQTEAMTLADRIVVLRAGRVEQVGRPTDLYDDPDNLFVAGFIGSPRMNFLPAIASGPASVRVAGLDLPVPGLSAALQPEQPLQFGIRPEHLTAIDGSRSSHDHRGRGAAGRLGLRPWLHRDGCAPGSRMACGASCRGRPGKPEVQTDGHQALRRAGGPGAVSGKVYAQVSQHHASPRP